MGLVIPPVWFEIPEIKNRNNAGYKFLSSVAKLFPGEITRSANIRIRWGQNTNIVPGETVVIFDCGYFNREKNFGHDRQFRLSINEYHPTRLPEAPGDRWGRLRISAQNLHDPHGHILLVGRGRKTRIRFGCCSPDWEMEAIQKLKAHYPGRKIIYRPKKNPRERIDGAETNGTSSIPELLKGCSLVYTQASNVGNEAVMYGIPVVTEGGPASDYCPTNIIPNIKPLREAERIDFLHRLAYWQWSINDIKSGAFWPWLFAEIERRAEGQ